jgi:hypothetical protein
MRKRREIKKEDISGEFVRGIFLDGSFSCISHNPDHIFFDTIALPNLRDWKSLSGHRGKLVFIPDTK